MKQLNSLISTLKSKLKRGRDDDDEEEYEDEDEEVGEETEVSEVKSKKAKKSKAADDEEDDEDEEGDEDEDEDDEDDEDEEEDGADEAQKQKRKKILIGVVVVLGAYVVIDEMFLKQAGDETVVSADPEASGGFKRPPKRERKKPGETPTAAAGAAGAAGTPAAAVETAAPEIEAPPIEEVAVTEATPAPVQTAAPTPEASQDSDVVVDESVSNNPFLQAPADDVGEVTQGAEEEEKSSATMEEVVAADIKKEYVAPPKYDQIGRGLVYNCGGKHWACVDKPAYFQCKDNYLHNSTEGKAVECYPSEVYASYDDCKTVQIHHINMVKEVDFCGGGQ